MGHNNTKGNRKFIKGRYTANAAKGERLVSSEFQLTFAGHEDISVLVRTSQIPEMTREDVEDGNDSNLLIVFYVQIMPDDLVMQLHRF